MYGGDTLTTRTFLTCFYRSSPVSMVIKVSFMLLMLFFMVSMIFMLSEQPPATAPFVRMVVTFFTAVLLFLTMLFVALQAQCDSAETLIDRKQTARVATKKILRRRESFADREKVMESVALVA
eukprot:1161676-Pelagomonas_calceolata.AAC.14